MSAVSKSTTAITRSPLRIRRSKQQAPASFYWWPVTAAKIRKAAQKIVDEVDPEKIILFGSFAYGEPTPDSDVDLFIVMKTSLRPVDRIRRVSAVLDPRPFPVDIIVRTPAELAEQLHTNDCFVREIIDKGQVIYERASRR
jgi:predicted nucleotidyltransferase